MKHPIALILSVCVPFFFSGCAKLKGQRIEFGDSFSCRLLRNSVFYIRKDDAPFIFSCRESAARKGCGGRSSRNSEYFGFPACDEADHRILQSKLSHYQEGFFGWF
jgi:hypothetical protein